MMKLVRNLFAAIMVFFLTIISVIGLVLSSMVFEVAKFILYLIEDDETKKKRTEEKK